MGKDLLNLLKSPLSLLFWKNAINSGDLEPEFHIICYTYCFRAFSSSGCFRIQSILSMNPVKDASYKSLQSSSGSV
ncbi:hypothetical protein DICPUDRAFT_155386 [Dictyostelium purpureum]|uniref:Uncharacterized protein n=1 Tax=Dictyostelium purpureum TaxID=5786 RepID=F0ZTV4_DICPU|nr:uncharacterized protein DICPUDRAFT_155386 [Dictyostelium purpureum]EGC32627.1 hypothetical protein DICPUDRAFT_155386 [Dictyostelium purpureum]|eukprot:XP_003290842.1 hypothetical protein DICPUDRAFT_155386 [Dictyostelium purpureum]